MWTTAAYKRTYSPSQLALSGGRPHSSNEPGHDDSSRDTDIGFIIIVIIIIIVHRWYSLLLHNTISPAAVFIHKTTLFTELIIIVIIITTIRILERRIMK